MTGNSSKLLFKNMQRHFSIMITSLLYNLQIDFCLQHEDYTIVPVSGRSGLVLWDDPEGWDGE